MPNSTMIFDDLMIVDDETLWRLQSEYIELRTLAVASAKQMNLGLTSEFQLKVYCSVIRGMARRIAPSIASRSWYVFSMMHRLTTNRHAKQILLNEAVKEIATFLTTNERNVTIHVKAICDELQRYMMALENHFSSRSCELFAEWPNKVPIDFDIIGASLRALIRETDTNEGEELKNDCKKTKRLIIAQFADLIAADKYLLRAFCRYFPGG